MNDVDLQHSDPMRTITITLEESMLRQLDSIAGEQATGTRNRSRIVRQALTDFIARRDRAAREAAEWARWAPHIDQINRQAAELVADQAEP